MCRVSRFHVWTKNKPKQFLLPSVILKLRGGVLFQDGVVVAEKHCGLTYIS